MGEERPWMAWWAGKDRGPAERGKGSGLLFFFIGDRARTEWPEKQVVAPVRTVPPGLSWTGGLSAHHLAEWPAGAGPPSPGRPASPGFRAGGCEGGTPSSRGLASGRLGGLPVGRCTSSIRVVLGETGERAAYRAGDRAASPGGERWWPSSPLLTDRPPSWGFPPAGDCPIAPRRAWDRPAIRFVVEGRRPRSGVILFCFQTTSGSSSPGCSWPRIQPGHLSGAVWAARVAAGHRRHSRGGHGRWRWAWQRPPPFTALVASPPFHRLYPSSFPGRPAREMGTSGRGQAALRAFHHLQNWCQTAWAAFFLVPHTGGRQGGPTARRRGGWRC